MSDLCGCCEGTAKLVPEALASRPGLIALPYRVGTHATFFETMLACLTGQAVRLANEEIGSWLLRPEDVVDPRRLGERLRSARDRAVEHILSGFDDDSRALLADEQIDEEQLRAVLVEQLNGLLRGVSLYSEERFAHLPLTTEIEDLLADESRSSAEGIQLNRLLLELALRNHLNRRQWISPLTALTTRDPSDPAIALLDAWATVADVITFYQERLANEGYLRTATERRSVLELGRLVGYEPRPGVSASVYLAFTLEEDHEVEIGVGTRAQSTPEPGELPQSFETAEPLEARGEWNLLPPRLERPQEIHLGNAGSVDRIYVAGTATLLEANDPLLLVFGTAKGLQFLRRVEAVEPDQDADRTLVRLQTPSAAGQQQAFLARVRGVIESHLKLDAFTVDASTATAQRVAALLAPVVEKIDGGDAAAVASLLAEETLPTLVAEHETATRAGFNRLEGWLGSLVASLSSELRSVDPSALAAGRPMAAARGAIPSRAIIVGETGQTGPLTALETFRTLELAEPLAQPRSLQPSSSLRLERNLAATYSPLADTLPRLLAALQPAYKRVLYAALSTAAVVPEHPLQVYAFRVTASLYGHNAPQRPFEIDSAGTVTLSGDYDFDEETDVVDLEAPFDKIRAGTWLAVKTEETPHTRPATLFALAGDPDSAVARADYGITGKVTRITLRDPAEPDQTLDWNEAEPHDPPPPLDSPFDAVRTTSVLAQAERLELADEPMLSDPPGSQRSDELIPVQGQRIELGALYRDLEPGRWVIVSGERSDIAGVTGVQASELAMISAVDQVALPTLPGDRLHSVLTLAGENEDGGGSGLSYSYKRDTVKIFGNVVRATHGETVDQVLGSGDGAKAFQAFALSRPPLTHVSAPTPAGADSELEVRLSGVLWDERQSLVELGQNDRGYIIRTDDEGTTSVIFGDGRHGARLPSGAENVAADYRTGIGESGNVDGGRIDQLADKPLGVKEVVNPLPASGGADRESRDQARENTPLAVVALDRLVSVSDYADFARTFAGIAKADARLLSDGRRRVLHLTVATAGDGPLDRNGDLYRNLRQALADFGDPRLAITLEARQVLHAVISARVRIGSAYLWENVEPEVRTALLDALGFERRRLAQGIARSEIDGALHAVRGVEYVDVDIFDAVDEKRVLEAVGGLAPGSNEGGLRLLPAIQALPARPGRRNQPAILPAQLVYLSDEVPDTLVLAELEP